MKQLVVVALMLVTLVLTACGGGSDSDSNSNPNTLSGRLGAVEKTVTGMSGYLADNEVKLNDILETLKRIETKLDAQQ